LASNNIPDCARVGALWTEAPNDAVFIARARKAISEPTLRPVVALVGITPPRCRGRTSGRSQTDPVLDLGPDRARLGGEAVRDPHQRGGVAVQWVML
jgi:hypothetical protein